MTGTDVKLEKIEKRWQLQTNRETTNQEEHNRSQVS